MHHKTIHDLNDVFESRTGACREYTLPREEFQFFKSKLYVVLTSTESKLLIPPHLERQTATWTSYVTMIQITLQKVVN